MEVDLASLGFSDAELQSLLEPEEHFDFSQYEEHLILTVGRGHALLPVKIPLRVKEEMNRAIKEYAATNKISAKSEAMLAGKVFASLLGMPPWTKP